MLNVEHNPSFNSYVIFFEMYNYTTYYFWNYDNNPFVNETDIFKKGYLTGSTGGKEIIASNVKTLDEAVKLAIDDMNKCSVCG